MRPPKDGGFSLRFNTACGQAGAMRKTGPGPPNDGGSATRRSRRAFGEAYLAQTKSVGRAPPYVVRGGGGVFF